LRSPLGALAVSMARCPADLCRGGGAAGAIPALASLRNDRRVGGRTDEPGAKSSAAGRVSQIVRQRPSAPPPRRSSQPLLARNRRRGCLITGRAPAVTPSLSSRWVASSPTAGLSLQDFFPGGFRAWPVAPCDFLYSDTELFGLSDFGFLASLLPLSWPFAIDSSFSQPRPEPGRRLWHSRPRSATDAAPLTAVAPGAANSPGSPRELPREIAGLGRSQPSRRHCRQWPRPIEPWKRTAKRRFWPSSRLS
jgi:hypothetical protein